ncbi:hypothetical protein NDU88_001009 [Pleurodeles waltl]|uniref:Uncharacterized protein n=1 Tax=Pleurodeles waltl TaxID=8319 RepID=A0AAV7MRJ6_PLEWA|nr:hypothetical protein NDU88_001009 [Pleurodeles waltl]
MSVFKNALAKKCEYLGRHCHILLAPTVPPPLTFFYRRQLCLPVPPPGLRGCHAGPIPQPLKNAPRSLITLFLSLGGSLPAEEVAGCKLGGLSLLVPSLWSFRVRTTPETSRNPP